MVVKNNNGLNSFEQLNEELNEFYKYLKENKYTDEEIRAIFQPLTSQLKRDDVIKYFFITLILLSFFIWLCFTSETIAWHASALGRIFLIKLLPYWDWQTLKDQQCLIKNFRAATETSTTELMFNCDVCENVDAIDTYETIDPFTLKIRYLDLDIPVVLTSSLHGWPQGSELIVNISSNKQLISSTPCSLGSNVMNGISNIGKILSRVKLFDSFFMHFQICETTAVKAFRSFVSKPKFLHAEIAPIQFDWILWSQNYNVSRFKVLELADKISVIGQILGANYFNLVPRNNCGGVCNVLRLKLVKGEVLVVTSLWNVEYRPEEAGENVAVVLETH